MSKDIISSSAGLVPQTLSDAIHKILEANYWGFALATMLLGISLCQGYIFFSRHNNSRGLKIFDLGCIFLNIIFYFFAPELRTTIQPPHVVLEVNVASKVLDQFRPLASMATISQQSLTLLVAESICTTMITFLTQLFFAVRIYRVDERKHIFPILVSVFAILAAAAGITKAVFIQVIQSFVSLQDIKYVAAVVSEGSLATVGDILATIAMCTKFVRSTKNSSRLDSVIKTLFLYALNRGVIVMSAQILIVIVYVSWASDLYWVVIHMSLGKVYVITLLSMLNARAKLRSEAIEAMTEEAVGSTFTRDPDLPDYTSMNVASNLRPSGSLRSVPTKTDVFNDSNRLGYDGEKVEHVVNHENSDIEASLSPRRFYISVD
ncbi:hypothetical protein BD410DRAFT_899817, partial [Rickenella mellea]